jgi:hypothetical protein
MDGGIKCMLCNDHGHKVSKCPSLYDMNIEPTKSGGSHSHDEDEECVSILNMLFLNQAIKSV